jgi:HK97 family phage major capsid protein
MNIREAFALGERSVGYDVRAMGQADLTAPTFADTTLRLVKEWDGLLSRVEQVTTDNGAPWGRPVVSAFAASGAATSENPGSPVSDGTSSLITFNAVQQFPTASLYAARLSASFALFQDSNTDLDALFASAAGESIGRQVASDAAAALYAQATTGQELTLTTLTASKLAGLIGVMDAGLLDGAAYYMSTVDAATVFGSSGIVPNAAGPRTLNGFPVVITSAATNYSSGTVSGPVLLNAERFLTLRSVDQVSVRLLRERYADQGGLAVNVWARMDVQPTGQTTACAFSK